MNIAKNLALNMQELNELLALFVRWFVVKNLESLEYMK
jgi:hypothetical protein